MAESPKKKHGGKRTGAGRPQLHSEGETTVIGASVPVSLVAKLDEWSKAHGKTRSEAITESVRRLTGDG